jgi:RNA polymerase sigma-70 factor (ECF subfamily)
MIFERDHSDLVHRARAGDGSAFAELLRPEYRAAVRLANALLHNLDEAEDAVQEAAIKAWRKLGNLREGSPLRPWFLAIVANECRNVQRTKWWSGRTNEDVPELEADATDVAAAVDLQRALVHLDYDQRLVLVLRYYMDMPFAEIALTLAISPKAARSRVERAVNRLRPILRIQEAVG